MVAKGESTRLEEALRTNLSQAETRQARALAKTNTRVTVLFLLAVLAIIASALLEWLWLKR
jgi:hypothetical protein